MRDIILISCPDWVKECPYSPREEAVFDAKSAFSKTATKNKSNMAIDQQDLDALNWTYVDQQTLLTARGAFRFDIYAGKIKFDGQEFDIPVHVGEGVPEVLLGRQWLQSRRLVVDMPSGILTLG